MSAPASSNAMTVARNPSFQDRVRFCLATAATGVMAEDSGAAGHALRVIYAKAVIAGTADFPAAAIVAITNTTLAAEATLSTDNFGISDGDLQFTVNSLFNALAGVAT